MILYASSTSVIFMLSAYPRQVGWESLPFFSSMSASIFGVPEILRLEPDTSSLKVRSQETCKLLTSLAHSLCVLQSLQDLTNVAGHPLPPSYPDPFLKMWYQHLHLKVRKCARSGFSLCQNSHGLSLKGILLRAIRFWISATATLAFARKLSGTKRCFNIACTLSNRVRLILCACPSCCGV